MRDGAMLHVRQWGRGHPVLMLSGLGMSSRHWWPFLAPFLAERKGSFRFILPDARGIGGSAQIHFAMRDVFEQHWQDAEDIVQQLRLKDFSLIGYSLGASVGLHGFAQNGWAGVGRYLHIDQSPCIPNLPDWPYGLLGPRQNALFEAFERIEAKILALDSHATLADISFAIRQSVLGDWQQISRTYFHSPQAAKLFALGLRWPSLLKQVFPMYRLADMGAYVHSYRHAHDYRPALANCTIPVTVLAGSCSMLYHPRGQQWLANTLVQGRYESMEGAGHLMAIERPVAFYRALKGFLHSGL